MDEQRQVPDVSIIIINYNTFELTCGCIESIITLTTETRYEIIIVDNNSTERNADEFQELYPAIKLIRNKSNIGFGRANNQGMAIARGTYVLLLNSDCILLNDVIDLAFRYAVDRPTVKIFGATLVNEDGSDQKSFYGISSISLISSIRSVLIGNPPLSRIMKILPKRKPRGIGGLYGAYIWLHRSVYEKVGGFDPDFFMYCEDTEWFRNRITPSFSIEICKEAKVCHLGGRSGAISIVNPQNVLSYFLYWYKLGKAHFWVYVLGSFINLIFIIIFLPFMTRRERLRNINYVGVVFKLIPKILFDIPRYGNGFGSRKSPLKTN